MVWGSTFVVVKLALTSVSPVLLVALRFAAAAAATLFYIILLRKRRPGRTDDAGTLFSSALIAPSILLGLALSGGYVFQTFGLLTTGPGKCAFITALYLVFTPFFSWLVNRKRVSVLQTVSLVIAMCGVYLLASPRGAVSAGDLYSLAGALCWAIHLALIDRFSRRGTEEALTFLQLLVVLIASTLVFLAIERPHAGLGLSTPWPLLGILYLGIPATTLVVLVQMRWQPHLGATSAALIYIGETVVASIGGVLVFGERLGLQGYLGCALILFSVFMVASRPARFARPRRAG